AVEEVDAWDTLLPVAAGMSPQPLQRLAQRPAMQNPTLLTKIADLALTQNLWLSLLPLATHLSPTQLHTVAARVATEPDDSLTTLIEQAHAESHWPTLLPVALALSTPDRKRLATLPVMHRPAYLTAAIEATATHNLWPEALPLLNDLPTTTHDTLATTINTLTDNQFRAAIQAATAADCTTTLIQILLRQNLSARSRSLTLLNEADNLETLVGTITTQDPAIWQSLSDIRTEIPEQLRNQLVAQATRCGQPELADKLTAS
ncbi:hypothetical protein ACFWF3_13125, partial [Nocardia sp. NPDC060220]